MPTTHSTSGGGTTHRVGRLAATLALLLTVLVLLADIVGGHLACGFDTSDCVSTSHKSMAYEGHLPFANTPFEVDFSSVRLAGGGLVGGFRTDSNGRYCIVWAPEDGTFVINGSKNYGYFYNGHPLHGRPPAGCQSGNQNVPWWRADDLTSSPQYLAVIGLALLTMTVLVIGIVSGRSKPAARVRAAGLALALASTALFLAVWWPAL
ncbi:MAG TPA: hypothetical protein VGF93_15060 [Solirubrobacteraceae bacterium]